MFLNENDVTKEYVMRNSWTKSRDYEDNILWL